MFLRDEISQQLPDSDKTGPLDEIVGGLDKLPTTLASKLPETVKINCGREVISLNNQKEKIQIVLRNTKNKSDNSDVGKKYLNFSPFTSQRRTA